MKAREVNRRIEALGGKKVRQTGSPRRYAVTYTKPDGTAATAYTTVAQHTGDVPNGTLAAIERDLATAFGEGWLR